MNHIRKGSIVVRKSHLKDVIFKVTKIIKTEHNDIAILEGIIERVVADSPIDDLELVSPNAVKDAFNKFETKINNRIKENLSLKLDKNRQLKKTIITGKILHLDGDRKYSEKSYNYYKKVGLHAVVRNIPEYKQPIVVTRFLEIYKPDILVVTGHDGMLKKGKRYYDIYNYRNSRYFIETVKKAREFDKSTGKNLVIFAGACQSYFEALISAGANFASSPARILIDFLDPLLVAEKIATTEKYKFVTIDDIAYELRDGKDGVSGIGANGKLKE